MVVISDFQPLLNQNFRVTFSDKNYPLTLINVMDVGTPFKSGARQPFSLTFYADASLGILNQGVYPVVNDSLGKREIFLIPRGVRENRCYYEAIYN
jgi:hypothetical protein